MPARKSTPDLIRGETGLGLHRAVANYYEGPMTYGLRVALREDALVLLSIRAAERMRAMARWTARASWASGVLALGFAAVGGAFAAVGDPGLPDAAARLPQASWACGALAAGLGLAGVALRRSVKTRTALLSREIRRLRGWGKTNGQLATGSLEIGPESLRLMAKDLGGASGIANRAGHYFEHEIDGWRLAMHPDGRAAAVHLETESVVWRREADGTECVFSDARKFGFDKAGLIGALEAEAEGQEAVASGALPERPEAAASVRVSGVAATVRWRAAATLGAANANADGTEAPAASETAAQSAA